jgi:hypothetical protein
MEQSSLTACGLFNLLRAIDFSMRTNVVSLLTHSQSSACKTPNSMQKTEVASGRIWRLATFTERSKGVCFHCFQISFSLMGQ